MSIKRVGGSRDPGSALRALATRIGSEKAELVLGAALVLEVAIKEKYSTPGRGRIYRKSRTVTHQASAPGDPAAPDTGNLRNSVTHELGGQAVRVGTNAPYAEALEFGTTSAGRSHNVVILPRPAFRPALEESRDQMGEAVKAALIHLAKGAKQ